MAFSTELSTLTALAHALSGSANLADSLDAALSTVADFLGLETGWVWLLDEGSEEPRLAAARALPPALRDHPEAMHGDCHCLSTFRAGDLTGASNVNVVWCTRLRAVVRSTPLGGGATTLSCHASVPLAVGARRLGMLNVASRDWRVLSDDELNLLTTAGALVSLAVERSRLEAAGARAAAAEERNTLAREIHDTLAQSLAALAMQLEVADTLVSARDDGRLREVVERALVLTRTTLDDARRSVLELREAPLEGRTLPDALAALARESATAPDAALAIRVTCDDFSDGKRLTAAAEVGLYRIAQQALGNVVRHARATTAQVRLTRDVRSARLRIDDDGVGFDPGAVPEARFGLVGMHERARLLGATLTIASTPGAGTSVEVVVPVRDR